MIDLETNSVSSDIPACKTFTDVLTDSNLKRSPSNSEVGSLKPIPKPKIIEGNVVVELDADEYKKGVEHLKFSVLGRLTLHCRDKAPTTMDVK